MRASSRPTGATGNTGDTGAAGPGGVGTLVLIGLTAAGASWAVPASATDLLGVTGFRLAADLTLATDYRIVAFLADGAAAGAKLRAMYATTGGGALAAIDSSGDIAADAAGRVTGTWTALPAPAQADVWVTVQGLSGNGAAEATIQYLAIEFR
jgi:hypothetical protein